MMKKKVLIDIYKQRNASEVEINQAIENVL